jgi:blue copper oxidase
MRHAMDLTRRSLLGRMGLAAGVCATSSFAALAMHGAGGMKAGGMKKVAPNWASPNFNPDVDMELTCQPGEASILEGRATGVWRYAANLLKGPENTLTTLPDSYLGPLMRFRKGQKIRIRLRNGLPEPTIAHWHGLHVPMLMDGHPMYAIDPGETFVYEFEMRNRAGLYFYHPHTHEATATQVYRGMAGAIIVGDDEEKALDLPSGEFEIPIVLQDRAFNDDNQLVYGGGMHAQMVGFQGDRILVNGRPDYAIDVASRAYRLRILNGSNSRIYKLAWDDASPITVIGVDGGLLEKPEEKPYVMLAPGERLDVWADFSGRSVGSRIVMRSAPFSGVLPRMARGMMGGMMAETALPVGGDYPLFTVRVARAAGDSPALPPRLARIDRLRLEDVANPGDPVPIAISEAPMAMLLNGRPYADNDALSRERIPRGDFSRWRRHGPRDGHEHGPRHGHDGRHGRRNGHDGRDDVDGASDPSARPAVSNPEPFRRRRRPAGLRDHERGFHLQRMERHRTRDARRARQDHQAVRGFQGRVHVSLPQPGA